MKRYYQLINKAACEFTAKNHHTPSKIYMTNEVYQYLLQEMYGNQWWILLKFQRLLGLEVIITDEVYDFTLK